ncbi:MAG: hypothetical protein HKN41_06570 [Ilumatobacter sp.]|nr:hypothetical protein [Ilumatobacter sp.]
MTSDEFDPQVLRRIDRPRRPAPDADDRIRRAMFDAFDAELESGETAVGDEMSGAAPAPRSTLELVPLDGEAADRTDTTDQPSGERPSPPRWMRWAVAAAAAALVVAIAAVALLRPDGTAPDSLDPADELVGDALTVNRFCLAEVAPLVDDVAGFHANSGGERTDRALRNVELLAQRFTDLASLLAEPLAGEVAATGEELLNDAAVARRMLSDDGDDSGIRTLAATIADELDALPGSEPCRTDELRGAIP